MEISSFENLPHKKFPQSSLFVHEVGNQHKYCLLKIVAELHLPVLQWIHIIVLLWKMRLQ